MLPDEGRLFKAKSPIAGDGGYIFNALRSQCRYLSCCQPFLKLAILATRGSPLDPRGKESKIQGVSVLPTRKPSPLLRKSVAALLRLKSPVAFDAVDGRPVDIIFGLLSPEHAGAMHLHALAAISRMMRDEEMHASLIAAPGAEAIYGLLCNVIDRDAA